MKNTIKNITIFLLSGIAGMIVNISIIIAGSLLIGPPEGVDFMDANSLKENIQLFKYYHFLFPFLAHAGGTLAGAFLVSKFAKSHQLYFAMGIGFFFLFGGIMNIKMIPAPLWFNSVDVFLPISQWHGWAGKWG